MRQDHQLRNDKTFVSAVVARLVHCPHALAGSHPPRLTGGEDIELLEEEKNGYNMMWNKGREEKDGLIEKLVHNKTCGYPAISSCRVSTSSHIPQVLPEDKNLYIYSSGFYIP